MSKRTVDANKKINSQKFAHFVLRVSSLENSIAWYEAVLGMRMVHDAGKLAFFTYDDEHHRLALVETPTAAPEKEKGVMPPPGLDHVAYTLESLEDLLVTYKRLKAQGILPVWPINHGLTTSLYYADPDGNRVEFQVENLETKDELNAYMVSEAFAANPIGVEFDPEKLLERFENGDSLEVLVQQGSA